MKALVVTFTNGEKATYPQNWRSSADEGVLMIVQPRPEPNVNGDWVCYNLRVIHHWGIEEVEG